MFIVVLWDRAPGRSDQACTKILASVLKAASCFSWVTLGRLARTLTHARLPGAYRRLAPFSGETRSWARLLKFSSSASM